MWFGLDSEIIFKNFRVWDFYLDEVYQQNSEFARNTMQELLKHRESLKKLK